MRLLKIKLATSLILGSVMFGLCCFSTTRIAAQETSSSVVAEQEAGKAGLTFKEIGLRATGAVIGAAAMIVDAVASFFASNGMPAEYPKDALD